MQVIIDGARRAMCCGGCAAVAQTIVDAGLEDYYRLRTELPQRAEERVPRILEQAAAYSRPALEAAYVSTAGEHAREAHLILEDVECAACAWLIERTLARAPGVLEVDVNFSTHRARVRWDTRVTDLGAVMEAVGSVGYRTQPYDPARREVLLAAERRARLRRLGVAGLLGMQIMMVAVVLYAGEWWGMEPAFATLFRWLSLALAVPVVAYAAWPFFTAAARGVANGVPGMDLPVALGIGIAFLASVHATVTGHGHVYFDSVAMFTFFLLLARHLEFLARKRAQERIESLVSPAPELARRLDPDGDPQLVPVAELVPGDRVRVLPGESVPADGTVVAGQGSVDESLLSGESWPRPRRVGDPVLGGSVNGAAPLEVRVEHVGPDMVVSRVLALVERAAAARPRLARLADRVAAAFVLAVVLIAVAVAAYWWQTAPGEWLAPTVAVLVVTCPCALSLATPTALTAAAGSLTAAGLVPARGLALEALARVNHVVFDKTGTLTTGRYVLRAQQVLRAPGGQSPELLLRTAVALERHSEHPLAQALQQAVSGPVPTAERVTVAPGQGIAGVVAGVRWWLGEPGWACRAAGTGVPAAALDDRDGATVVVLAGEDGTLGVFRMGDELRPGASALVAALKARGLGVSLLSGDRGEAVERVADALGIGERQGGLLPQHKLERLRAMAGSGRTTVMVGDGINDAPVLAGASVSVAMGCGAQAARASADFILVSERLEALLDALDLAVRAQRTVRENLTWALAYNLLALPAAAAGLIAPWMAALGMSLSSLLVVSNSLRLGRASRRAGTTAGATP
jgi:Cu2+-exporting ATPase